MSNGTETIGAKGDVLSRVNPLTLLAAHMLFAKLKGTVNEFVGENDGSPDYLYMNALAVSTLGALLSSRIAGDQVLRQKVINKLRETADIYNRPEGNEVG